MTSGKALAAFDLVSDAIVENVLYCAIFILWILNL
jgi:hypothetical protein